MMRAIRHLVAVPLLSGAFLFAGCGSGGTDAPDVAVAASASEPASAPIAPPMPETAQRAKARAGAAPAAAVTDLGAAGTSLGGPVRAPAPVDAMIVRTGNASVEVRRLDEGLATMRRVATAHGAWVAGSSRQGGRDQVPEATLELKVSAARFEGLARALDSVGRVEYAQVSAEDVTEEAVDLRARRANAQRLEARLLQLVSSSRGRLQDVLAIERELARVREEVERIDGRLRWLETRAAVSTLTVRLHEPVPVSGIAHHPNVIADAFGRAWRNAIGTIAGLIAFLGGALPVLLIVGLPLWWSCRWWLRRRERTGVAG